MNLSSFIFFILVVSTTPGPNNILSLANAGKYGFKKTLPFIFGVSIGMFTLLMITMVFGVKILEIFPKIKGFMGIIGASYMLYLAYNIINDKTDLNEIQGDEETKQNSLTDGFLLQIINPKAVFFTITLMSNFILPNIKSVYLIVLISVFIAVEIIIAVSSWALFGSIFQKVLSKNRIIFNRIMAMLLLYSAITVSGII